MPKWEVKKDGESKCYGDSLDTLPNEDVLQTLRECGYKVYIDGKLHKEQKKGKRNAKVC